MVYKRLIALPLMLVLWLLTSPFAHAQAPDPAPAFQAGDIVHIIGLDGVVPLWLSPFTQKPGDSINVEAVVQIEERLNHDDKTFYLVTSLADKKRRGWVPEELLHPMPEDKPYIGNVRVCTTRDLRPRLCGTRLSLTGEDTLQATLEYFGAPEGGHLQWIIVIDEERYASALVPLANTRGARVIDLLDIPTPPPITSGTWTIWFYIDNEFIRARELKIEVPASRPTWLAGIPIWDA